VTSNLEGESLTLARVAKKLDEQQIWPTFSVVPTSTRQDRQFQDMNELTIATLCLAADLETAMMSVQTATSFPDFEVRDR
jgi:hypothetical protein